LLKVLRHHTPQKEATSVTNADWDKAIADASSRVTGREAGYRRKRKSGALGEQQSEPVQTSVRRAHPAAAAAADAADADADAAAAAAATEQPHPHPHPRKRTEPGRAPGAQPHQPSTQPRKRAKATHVAATTAAQPTQPDVQQSPAATVATTAAIDALGEPNAKCQQDPKVIARICELGKTNITVAAIETMLKAEGYVNSGGQPWLSPNDGKVVARILVKNGIAVNSTDQPRLADYVRTYLTTRAA
jgi:hypothetical protein